MKKITYVLAISLITLSCGNETTTTIERTDLSQEKTNPEETSKSPCQLISETQLKSLLELPEAASATIKDVVRTYPSCFYDWENETYSQTRTFGGKAVNIDYPTSVSIVRVDNATEISFQTSSKAYRDGVAVQGIGDMAIWGDLLSQITFVAKGTMIHLSVKKSGDSAVNKAAALEIAKVIIGNL